MAKQDFIEEATPAFDGGSTRPEIDPKGSTDAEPKSKARKKQESVTKQTPAASKPAPQGAAIAGASAPLIVESTSTDVSWEEEKTILLFDDEETVTEVWMVDIQGQRIDINDFPFVIGRNPEAGICLRDNGISRKHAQIVNTDDGEYVIEDLGSVNGISVNNHKTKKVVLSDGDSVVIGDKRFSYTFHVQSSGAIQASDVALADTDQDLASKMRNMLAVVQEKIAKLESGGSSGTQEDGDSPFDERTLMEKIPRMAAVLLPIAAIMGGYYFYSLNKRVVSVAPPVAQTDSATQEPAAAPNDSAQQAATAAATRQALDSSTAQQVIEDTVTSSEVAVGDSSQQVASAASQAASTVPVVTETNIAPVASTEVAVDNATMTTESDNTVVAGAIESAADKASDQSGEVTAPATEIASAAVVEAAPKPIRRSPEWSRNYIQNSMNMYLDGDAEAAVERLEILSRSSRHQQQFRDESAAKASRLGTLYRQFQQGQFLSTQGQRDAAFVEWQRFLLAERAMFPGGVSVYAQQIEAEVVNEYQAAGDRAYAEGNYHSAFTSWEQAASIEPNGLAAQSLDELRERAKRAYIDGYQQESVNIKVATTHWNEVVALVPSGSEYHTKAKAKLKLYRSYGAQ